MDKQLVKAIPAEDDDELDEVESVGWFSRLWQWIRGMSFRLISAVVGEPSGMIDMGVSVAETVVRSTLAVTEPALVATGLAVVITYPGGTITLGLSVLIALAFRLLFRTIRAIIRYFREQGENGCFPNLNAARFLMN